MLKFASLGSGSEGNSFLVKSHQATVMVDCGFNFKETSKRLKKLDIDLSEISGILITHEHEDHCKSVSQILKNNNIKIYSTYGTAKRLDLINDIEIINTNELIQINDIKISIIPVPHDASEPCHFVFESNNTKIGIITDFGFVTNKIKNNYSDLNLLVVEANHDEVLLENSRYPRNLKKRILGKYGHVDNKTVKDFIVDIKKENLKKIIFCHLSKNNNSKDLVKRSMGEIFEKYDCEFIEQEKIFDWIQLDGKF